MVFPRLSRLALTSQLLCSLKTGLAVQQKKPRLCNSRRKAILALLINKLQHTVSGVLALTLFVLQFLVVLECSDEFHVRVAFLFYVFLDVILVFYD